MYRSSCAACRPPDNQREYGYTDNHGHEYAGYAVCQTLYRGFASLCLLHHGYDACQKGVGAYGGCAVCECAGYVDRAGIYLVSLMFFDREWLAAEHTFVQMAFAARHCAVYGYLFSRACQKHVSGRHLRDIGDYVGAVSNNSHGRRLEAHQTAYGRRCIAFCPGFQCASQQYESYYHARCLEIYMCLDAARGPEPGVYHGKQAEQIGYARA